MALLVVFASFLLLFAGCFLKEIIFRFSALQ